MSTKDLPDEDTTYSEENDDLKHQKAKPPSVVGEEDPFSGDATSSESPDIDEELEKVGLQGDKKGVKPLDVQEELQDEEL